MLSVTADVVYTATTELGVLCMTTHILAQMPAAGALSFFTDTDAKLQVSQVGSNRIARIFEQIKLRARGNQDKPQLIAQALQQLFKLRIAIENHLGRETRFDPCLLALVFQLLVNRCFNTQHLLPESLRCPGRLCQISSAVKLVIGAIQRASASATW